MPPPTKCVLCSKKLRIHQRRPVNQHLIRYLRKNFLLECSRSDYICGKCSRRPAYPYQESVSCSNVKAKNVNSTDDMATSSQTLNPPSVRLSIKCASKSHAYCFICKKPGPRLVVVPETLRIDMLLRHNILITTDSRCCPSHLNGNLDSFDPAVLSQLKTMDHSYLNRTTILELLNKLREVALKSSSKRMSFDSLDSYSDEDLLNMTGLNKEQFVDLYQYIQPHIRNTPARTSLTTLGLFLFKMKSGLSNKFLSTLFGISKASVRRAIHSVRQVLMLKFVPSNLGFSHVSREDVLHKHTRALAQSLLAENDGQAILVLDGTYIYINKSNNFQFQRRSYSVHKGRPLVKPMIIVSTTGYYVSVLGPYFADAKNNNASILNHIMNNNIEEIKDWVKPSDIFVVDRGFRDSVALLKDLGIQAEIPAFMKRGEKQMSTEEANTSRLVTKVSFFLTQLIKLTTVYTLTILTVKYTFYLIDKPYPPSL